MASFYEYTDDLGRKCFAMTTPEGMTVKIGPLEYGAAVAWIKAWDAPSAAREVVAQPPPGRSLVIILVGAVSDDLLAVNTHWYIRNPDGSYTALGDTNVDLGQNSKVLSYNITAPVEIHDKGALCVTTDLNDHHGVLAVGWII